VQFGTNYFLLCGFINLSYALPKRILVALRKIFLSILDMNCKLSVLFFWHRLCVFSDAIKHTLTHDMKKNKTRSREITKDYMSNKSMQRKEKAINVMVFSIIFFIAVLLLTQIV
jgi:hypothetical protein